MRVDGFRPGKVPVKVVRQRFGEQVRHEAYGEIIQSTFHEAAVQEKLKPAGEPRIEVKEKRGRLRVYRRVRGDARDRLGGPERGHGRARKWRTVSDEDVDAMLEKLRKQRTTWNTRRASRARTVTG